MNEKNVIKKCQAGEEGAFNELISTYYPFVKKYILKLVKDEEVAKDLVQDTFLKLIKNIDKFDLKREEKFSTYCLTIAKNNCLDYFRKNKEILFLENYDYDIADNVLIEEEVIKKESAKMCLEELEKLPLEQRRVLKLKYLEDYTTLEIANSLGEKAETIKSRLYEGRKKLRNKLGDVSLWMKN